MKRTSMNIDRDLVAQTARELGTTGTTETIHAAMRELLAARRRAAFMASEWPVPTLEELRRDREEDPEHDVG